MKKILSIALLACAFTASAQTFPDKPIKLVVPFPPGGQLDFIARSIQPKVSELLGVPIVIENRGGASGIIGAAHAAKQPADGYTLFLGNTGTNVIFPAVYEKLSYEPFKDFVGVARTSTAGHLVVIHPSLPAKNMQEFIAYAKANPGKVSVAVAGVGSSSHFAIEMMKQSAGIDLLMVPYKASAPALQDLLGGQIQLLIDAAPVAMEHAKNGRLRALAVTGDARLATLPDVPTMDEAGVAGVKAAGFQGVFAPTGVPEANLNKLAEAIVKVVDSKEIRDKFTAAGMASAPMDARTFDAFVRSEGTRWADIAKVANIRADQ
jgi:tripartite-type tricarboxylate transporter receptor subunit TctC